MRASLALAAALVTLVPSAASAHRFWMVPSATTLSGDEAWVTVDAAIGNVLFAFDHVAMPLDDVTVHAPGGGTVEPQNTNRGRLRSTFDVQLQDEGTYRISTGGSGLFASYMLDGERRRWRGSADELSTGIPKGAEEVRVSQSDRRLDTFVTLGAPSEDVIAPSGEGLEVEYLTHPNDLFEGEPASFRLLMDGEPMAGAEVAVVKGGERYRDETVEQAVTTGEDGTFEVSWDGPGMYWMSAETEGEPTVPQAESRRATYVATLEVLPL